MNTSTKDKEVPPTATHTIAINDASISGDNVTPFLQKVTSSMDISYQPKAAPLEALHRFIREIREGDTAPELIANKYLDLYDKEARFIIKLKDVQKFLPNVNVKAEIKLLSLFGITPTMAVHPKNPKDILYFFNPHQYILTTMINSVSYPSFEERIEFAFKMYDSDNDGKISKADLKEMFSIYGRENAFRMTNDNIEAITNVISRSMGQTQEGLVSLTEFKNFFQNERTKSIKINVFERRKAKTHFSRIESKGASFAENKRKNPNCLTKTGEWIASVINLAQKSTTKLTWVFIWLIGLVYFFVSAFIKYYSADLTAPGVTNQLISIGAGIAKGAAGVIDYNCAVMILLATKSFTTAIRAIGLGRILPVNINVYLHTRIGFTTFAATWIHTFAHLTVVMPALSRNEVYIGGNLAPSHPYLWWVFVSVPGITGILGLIVMTLMVVLAIKQFRTKNYERFWYTHALWLPFVLLISFHSFTRYLGSPKFYLFVGLPAFILICEKIYVFFMGTLIKRFKIIDLLYHESEVIELKVSRPHKFKFIPGQYARVKIPKISSLQWHPFSFSSSQDDDYISFHISPIGDWTTELKKLALDFKTNKLAKIPSVYVLGPYGAPSQHYSDYRHLMIISSGIGATPFASIMREINNRVKKDPNSSSRTMSVDFYWVNKKPSSHIWLTSLFKELQTNEAVKGLFRIQMFFTSPHEKYDLRSILLWKGLEILYGEGIKIKGLEHFDLMRWGRPEWSEIFQNKVQEVGKGKVGVFFCGNHTLAKEVHDKCVRHSGDVAFEFCKEIFG